MNPLESQLHYPLGDTLPQPGSLLKLAPGVYWLRLGLPFALNHINLWLLHDGPGWTAVDCGIDTENSRASWESVFSGHLDKRPLQRVIATHCHPDHVGLAHWLCERWNAPLCMTAGEYGFARMMSAALPGADGTAALPHFQRHGLRDPELIAQLQTRKSYYPTLVPAVPAAYTRLQDREQVVIDGRAWRIITGAGHSPEHAALYCDELKMLISGDMVLPRISTNVSVFAIEPESNPVQLYLESLKKFRDLPEDTLVLPSHGKPFRGLHRRLVQLTEHHAARLAEVAAACEASPKSAADIVPIMFPRELDAHQLTFALGEALAHLHKLWFDGLLQRETGKDGVVRFHASAVRPSAKS